MIEYALKVFYTLTLGYLLKFKTMYYISNNPVFGFGNTLFNLIQSFFFNTSHGVLL